jgi:hypothetical protein
MMCPQSEERPLSVDGSAVRGGFLQNLGVENTSSKPASLKPDAADWLPSKASRENSLDGHLGAACRQRYDFANLHFANSKLWIRGAACQPDDATTDNFWVMIRSEQSLRPRRLSAMLACTVPGVANKVGEMAVPGFSTRCNVCKE